ncbi:hypothetical protein CUU66_05650 [Peribacillus deserti]|uniref:Uncharacterized protein n=1 Tax=Peribacillus deserti TaxID=673318 RepID=A0A2N5M931_9BACI|nr:hypothetical protein CUU66_05650 [Peribacillus deserti]
MERKVRDSCGSSGTGETPQSLMPRGCSPPAPRKASILTFQSTTQFKKKTPVLFNERYYFNFNEYILRQSRYFHT